MNSVIHMDPVFYEPRNQKKDVPSYLDDFYNKYGLDPALVPYEICQEAEKTGIVSSSWMSKEYLERFEKRVIMESGIITNISILEKVCDMVEVDWSSF